MKRKRRKRKKKFEFSKVIILQESALVWYSTVKLLNFAEESIRSAYTGSLPYITTLVGAIWAAYGVSVAFYYNKAKAENLNRFGIADYEDISTLKEKEQQNDGYTTNNLE